MPKIQSVILILGVIIEGALFQENNENLRVCVVEGKGSYRRAIKFCPNIEKPEEKSGIECVLANDRLDCLRRMSKGTVDFGVFSPEDLMAAQWAKLDVLVTNELRNRPEDFERQIVAVVKLNDTSKLSEVYSLESDLWNKTLCHPGIGGDDARGLSETLSQYLESLVTPKLCESDLTLAENRIKSMATFFGKSCKAGPWVPDAKTNIQLKTKYPSLCAACGNRKCASNDIYWGTTGALHCMVDGNGDMAWVSLKDVKSYFTKVPNAVERFGLLCQNGTIHSINNTDPCVWLRRPWPSVVAKRKSAEAVSRLMSTLTNNSVTVDEHWRGNLTALLEAHRAFNLPLSPSKAPLDYLSRATGFREAYSQSSCTPPRHITLCTTNTIGQHKCDWLSEAAAVYGVDPPLQCILRATREECFKAIDSGDSDVTIADADWLVRSKREYSVEPILFEVTPIIGNLNTVGAYVNVKSNIKNAAQFRGKSIALPTFDGVAWHSIVQTLKVNKDIEDCGIRNLVDYFGDSCLPGIERYATVPKDVVEQFTNKCNKDVNGHIIGGEMEALRLLVEGQVDVAYFSLNTFKLYNERLILDPWAKSSEVNLTSICPENNKQYCLQTWSSLGQIYVSRNSTSMKKEEITYMFKKLDQLFGKDYPFRTPVFAMYGSFMHQSNVIFHNNTNTLVTIDQLNNMPYNRFPLNFESNVFKQDFKNCYSKANLVITFSYSIVLSLVLLILNS